MINRHLDSLKEKLDIDPSLYYAFTQDMMRIDVGLMIQRPPIFLRMRQQDIDFVKDRNDLMNEYYIDAKQFTQEFRDVSKLNEDVLAHNPYASRMNLDNYPTHQLKNPQTGQVEAYSAASKHWSHVDPKCMDTKSLHYASEDRVFLIVKNKYTNEWEFPISRIYLSETFFRAKLNLFNQLTGNKWRIKFQGQGPLIHTIREFTEVEKLDKMNKDLKGVRSFFFAAYHWRGLPEMIIQEDNPENTTEYNDWAWIPKRRLNEYFTKEYYDVFIDVCLTR